jgi:hypothetical protein
MKLDSISFLSGDARKASDAPTQNVSTAIAFTSAEVSGDSLSLGFDYSSVYTPDGSYIRIGGRAVFSGKEAGRAYEEWSKTKRISGEHGEYMLNAINYGASMNAIMIAKVFNMAPPVLLPRLTFEAAAGQQAAGQRKAAEKKR